MILRKYFLMYIQNMLEKHTSFLIEKNDTMRNMVANKSVYDTDRFLSIFHLHNYERNRPRLPAFRLFKEKWLKSLERNTFKIVFL